MRVDWLFRKPKRKTPERRRSQGPPFMGLCCHGGGEGLHP